MGETFEGGCACGEVRYRLTSRPLIVHCCHCTDCQRQNGGAFIVNALIEADRIELLTGEPEAYPVPAPSGLVHAICRCPTCQTAVWSKYGGGPAVRVGTLDEPAAMPPDVHIFTRSKLPWVVLPQGTPAFDTYYDMKALWPAESLARAAALGR